MADRLILEDGTGFIILEDNSGVLELDNTVGGITTITVSGNSGSTIGGITDTELNQFNPTANSSTDTQAYVDAWVAPNYIVTMFLKIPIPSVSGTVSGAEFEAFLKDRNYQKSDLSLFEILRNDALPSEATYDVYKTGSVWSAGGAQGSGSDRGATALATVDIGSTAPGVYITFTGAALDALIQDAITNAKPFIYLNVQFTDLTPTAASYVRFATSEGADGERPRLRYVLTSSGGSINFDGFAGVIVTSAGIINTGILLQGAAVSLGSASANISTGVTFTGAALSLVNASGDIASPTQFFANAQDVATLTGAMTTAIRAAVNAMGVSTGTGNISTGINMAGNAQDNVSASGQVNSQIRFVANAADIASASGGLSTGVNLNGFAASIVTVNGNPTMQIRLSADALSQVLASAGFNTGVLFNGDAQGIVNASVALSTAIRAAGNAQGQASASAGLSIGAGLSGNAQDTVVVTVALNTQIRLSGSPQAVSAAVASLSGVATQMQAQAVGVVSASAALTTGAKLSGNAQDVVTAIVNITTQIPLTAAVLAQAISGGQIITNIRLSGFAADDAGSSGTLSFAATVTPYSFSTKASSHQAIISHLAPQSLRCNAQPTTYIDTEVRLAA